MRLSVASTFSILVGTLIHYVQAGKMSTASLHSRAFVSGPWSLFQDGTTGVSAMQLAIVSETSAIILDKVEHNPLIVDGHIAWTAELDLNTKVSRPLNAVSNTWCATGSFLGNGTLVSSGGNPIVITGESGLQAIRLFTPCTTGTCDIFEEPTRVHLTSDRWYPASVRLEDGSVMIFGGSVIGGFANGVSINNPTYEFYPPKNIHGFNGLQIPSQFLVDTLNSNHFPILIQLPDGRIFIAANQDAMLFDWKTNTETRLPGIPNGVRVSSPFSASAALLPLTPENDYTPEVLICGGSTISDTVDPTTLNPQIPASPQCSRLLLTPAGIRAGWKVEQMPQARVMPDLILLPDMRIIVVNGANTGVAGYGFVQNPIGQSAADNPASTPVIYNPAAPAGSRFSSDGIPTSPIARMYHSTASLTPNGTIMLAGSNPNDDVSTIKYPTEYRLEFYSPPYMSRPRPTYKALPATVNYNSVFKLSVQLPSNTRSVTVSLMDLGFATHGVHMDQRLVKLVSVLSPDKKTLTVIGPPTPRIFPPGPAFLYVVTDTGVPSFGHRTIIGTGASPPVDQGAIDNLLSLDSVNPFVSSTMFPTPISGEGSNLPTAVISAQ